MWVWCIHTANEPQPESVTYFFSHSPHFYTFIAIISPSSQLHNKAGRCQSQREPDEFQKGKVLHCMHHWIKKNPLLKIQSIEGSICKYYQLIYTISTHHTGAEKGSELRFSWWQMELPPDTHTYWLSLFFRNVSSLLLWDTNCSAFSFPISSYMHLQIKSAFSACKKQLLILRSAEMNPTGLQSNSVSPKAD